MKISSKDFRVREGDAVNLKKWPTIVKAVYKSKEQYEELLREHVAATKLATAASLRIQSPCRPADLSGDGRARSSDDSSWALEYDRSPKAREFPQLG